MSVTNRAAFQPPRHAVARAPPLIVWMPSTPANTVRDVACVATATALGVTQSALGNAHWNETTVLTFGTPTLWFFAPRRRCTGSRGRLPPRYRVARQQPRELLRPPAIAAPRWVK
jgi:hypothetical protein